MLYSILTLVIALSMANSWGVAVASETPTNGDYQQFSPEAVQKQIDKYKDQARKITKNAHSQQRKAVRKRAENREVKAFATHIRRSLGIDPERGQLYVFVSMSMSDNMLRSYLQEGAWAGAQLVVRGIPKGMTMKQYLLKVMKPLVQGEPGAGIKIDPRLFDEYGVTTVPTIVWQPGDQPGCKVGDKKPRKDAQDKSRLVQVCGKTKREHWSVEGAVTLDWALRKFADKGSRGAGERLAILRKNVKGRAKNQKPYKGDWNDARLPGRKYNPTRTDKRKVLDYTKGLFDIKPLATPGSFQQ